MDQPGWKVRVKETKDVQLTHSPVLRIMYTYVPPTNRAFPSCRTILNLSAWAWDWLPVNLWRVSARGPCT